MSEFFEKRQNLLVLLQGALWYSIEDTLPQLNVKFEFLFLFYLDHVLQKKSKQNEQKDSLFVIHFENIQQYRDVDFFVLKNNRRPIVFGMNKNRMMVRSKHIKVTSHEQFFVCISKYFSKNRDIYVGHHNPLPISMLNFNFFSWT